MREATAPGSGLGQGQEMGVRADSLAGAKLVSGKLGAEDLLAEQEIAGLQLGDESTGEAE